MTKEPHDQDKNQGDFAALMADVRPMKGRHDHASRRSDTALVLDLRRDPDHLLSHLSKPGTVSASSRQLDGTRMRKLKAGKMALDGTLDLHGMTLDRARTAFRHFVAEKAQAGARCVLVITGKGEIGEGTPEEPKKGHIRRALPVWASEKPLDHLVLQVVPAAPIHGGTGAFYIALRRV